MPRHNDGMPTMNASLRVGLTTSISARAGSHGQPAVFLYTNYIDALAQIGLTAVLITPAHTRDAIEALLSACQGLVLTGGEDVDPAYYGERPSPALGSVQRARDEMEFTALDVALARGMPIFGICRGVQVINVHFGGTLYQDINTERPGDLLHQQTTAWDKDAHAVSVDAASLLGSLVCGERLFINSFHHQAAKDVGRDLRVVARADDGLIEAIEHTTYPWLLGVQWHPERNEATAPDTDPDRRLFAGFRDAVRDYAGTLAGTTQ
jgi:putative glutamine amidotransferase